MTPQEFPTPRERPILMSAPMVRATLERRKTQTRRVITPQPPEGVGRILLGRYEPAIIDRDGELQPGSEIFGAYDEDGEWGVRCPYGEPGDRLWVRETWATDSPRDDLSPKELDAQARVEDVSVPLWYTATDSDTHWRGRLRPSIHMPRWASRITLAVMSVRVERLQEISEEDARAEGAPARLYASDTDGLMQHRHGFHSLWQSINGERPGCAWSDNPHVWCIGFEMIGGGSDG